VTSAFSEPVSTAEVLETPQSDVLPAGMASSPTDLDDETDVPLWIVFPLCAAVIVVLGFVIIVILIR